ncbi:MAG: isocitrate/isopropylmalate dehydrogenase family protein [Bryobacter sp.]|jgi:3-isopropylmalate dehydrogenase|nr:isocitrate/isopropylmalate dehydrogenase family protein [Bryobacter sp. CoA8 C33]
MVKKQIAVLPGDGIGPEVIESGLAVLRALPELDFEFLEMPCGAGEYLRQGDPLPQQTIEICRQADAVLLGAAGLPNVRWADGREMAPQIDIREIFGLYAGVRPTRIYNPAHSPLKNPVIDYVLVRESTEGLFSTRLRPRAAGADAVRDEMLISRAGSERLFHFAFRLAQSRRNKLTLVDKANVLPSMAFFRQVFDEVAAAYPGVETERIYVDAMALYLVQRPQCFDVLVTENMFGDILSDLAAATVGGMGMAPSADIGDAQAVFQPAHGSAPDIAGQGKANPVATILSVAMMLEWFADPDSLAAAVRIRRAVESVLADPLNATADLGGNLSTPRMTEKILAAL